jgi:hypothetical protein
LGNWHLGVKRACPLAISAALAALF